MPRALACQLPAARLHRLHREPPPGRTSPAQPSPAQRQPSPASNRTRRVPLPLFGSRNHFRARRCPRLVRVGPLSPLHVIIFCPHGGNAAFIEKGLSIRNESTTHLFPLATFHRHSCRATTTTTVARPATDANHWKLKPDAERTQENRSSVGAYSQFSSSVLVSFQFYSVSSPISEWTIGE